MTQCQPRTAFRLLVGDAREKLAQVARSSVDLVVTSPPYFGLRDYGVPGEIGSEDTPREYVDSIMAVLDQVALTLKPSGSVFLVIGDKYARTGGVDRKVRGVGADPAGRAHPRPVQRGVPGVTDGSLVGLPARVALAAIDKGWVWRQEIIWHKSNPLPESVRTRCVRSHETILHLALTNRPWASPELQRLHDVWTVPVARYSDAGVRHPAVFPSQLVARIIRDYCPEGGVVLDPFAGSGTTLEVAVKGGCTAVGVELNPLYEDVIRRRLRSSS